MFDMDGVLFDSMPFHAVAWVQTLSEEGLRFSEYQVYLQEGRTGAGTINDVFMDQKGRKATEAEIERLYARKSEIFNAIGRTVPMPWSDRVIEFLKDKGVSIGLVTGSGQGSLLEKLNHYYPDTFAPSNMVTSFDVKQGKPFPEPYLIGLEKLGLKPEEAVVVENAPLGVRAGKAAGIYTVAVNTGILKPQDLYDAGADIVFDSMHDLYDALSGGTLVNLQA